MGIDADGSVCCSVSAAMLMMSRCGSEKRLRVERRGNTCSNEGEASPTLSIVEGGSFTRCEMS